LTWSEDGAHIYTTGKDKRVRCWDMSTGHNALVRAKLATGIRSADVVQRKYPTVARGSGQQVINPGLVSATKSDPQLIFITSGKDVHAIRADSGIVEQKIEVIEGEVITAMVTKPDSPGLLCGMLDGRIRVLGAITRPSHDGDEEEEKLKRLDQIYQSFLQNPIV
jgi:hypothetical protein